MTVSVEGLGPLADLATAVGLVRADDQLDPGWFADPGAKVSRALRDEHQRAALLRAADALLGQGNPVTVDAQGRHWIPLVSHGGVELDCVVAPSAQVTTIGVGARLQTSSPAPVSHVTVLVPLVAVPASGGATLTFATGDGRIEVDADIRLDAEPAHPGDPALAGIALHADVTTGGADPHLAVTLQGLQLPGEPAPHDVGLDSAAGDLADQAISLLAGLVQRSVAAASGELAELLALVGIGADPRIPVLPVVDLVTSGASAWRTWLDSLLADQQAVTAWLEHLGTLVGHGATASGSTGPDALGSQARLDWALASGVHLAAVVTVTRTPDARPQVELGVQAHIDATGTPAGRLEASATLVRITLGPAPAAVALPDVEVSGRIGHAVIAAPADLLLDLGTPEVVKLGSLRAGLTLDGSRRPALVLAAHDVTIATHDYPVLDLTNPQTLADIAGSALDGLAAAVLARLGPAADLVTVLLGVRAPDVGAGAPWTVPLVGLPALLADPVGALVGYHRTALAQARDRYPLLLEPLRELLRSTGVDVAVTGDGTADSPWRVTLADGVAVLAWTQGSAPEHLHLGIGVQHAVVDLGGGCPTVDLDLTADLVDLALDGSGGHALPGLRAALVLGARGGIPLRIGDETTALVTDRIGVGLGWAPGSAFSAGLVAPGLAAVIDGESVPVTLPTLAPDGTLTGTVPWRALELLAGHVLVGTGFSWAADLADLTGWLPRTAAARGLAGGSGEPDLPLEELVADPVGTLRAWARELIADGRLAELGRRVALLLTGESVPGLPAGVITGHGTARSPFALPLVGSQVDAALRAEVLLWGRDLEPVADAFRPGALFAALDPARASTVTGADLLVALLAAAAHAPDLRDALTGRDDLAAGLEGLVARWTGTDGLVRAVDAVLPGAVLVDVPDLTADRFSTIDLAALTGVGLEAGTVIAVGPLGPTAWAGIPDDHVLDWTAAGLVPEAFDDAGLRSGTGPWLVRLPGRAAAAAAADEDGATRQADRLARAVTAVAAALTAAVDGNGVQLVGVGSAGHAAVDVAARGLVATLVTVGTPHAGIGLDVLEVQPAAGAVQLLRSLLPPVDETELAAVTLGRGLLAPLTQAYDATTSPLADLVPPGTVPALPADLPVWCVRGVCEADSARSAATGLVVRALQEAYESTAETADAVGQDAAPGPDAGPGAGAGADDGVLHLGVAVTVAPPAAPGELSLRTSIALTREAFSDAAAPGLRLRVELGRAGGWLAGGPDPTRPADVARHPSVRRASLEVDVAHGGDASARVILYEAEVFGVSRTRWVLSHSDAAAGPLVPEALVVLSRVGSALAASASAATAQVTGLLTALGLSDPGAAFAFSADGLRRLLVDPAGLLSDVTAAATAPRLAAAAATLVGAPAPSSDAPTRVRVTVSGAELDVDVASGAVSVAVAGLPSPLGVQVAGRLDLAADRALSGSLTLAFGPATSRSGRPVLEVTGGAQAGVIVRWEGGGSVLPASVRLAPAPDAAALGHWLVALAPSTVLWAGISFLRSLQAGAVALVDPLLTALGLLAGTGDTARVTLPVGLIADPVHWLEGADVAGLVDAAGAMLGLPQPRPGTWTLPYGLELSATTANARTTLALRLDEPVADVGLRIAGSVGVELGGSGRPAAPAISVDLGVPGAGPLATSGRLTVTVGSTGLTARLLVPSAGIDLALLPNGPGLAALGGALASAATAALPYVLDAVAALPPAHPAHDVGVAVGALGDALGLRPAGQFSAGELTALAADPGPQLAQRLRRGVLADAVQALVDFLAPTVPPGWAIVRDGDDLVVTHTAAAGTLGLRMTVPDGGGLPPGAKVVATLTGLRPLTGATLDLGVSADASGLLDGHVSFAVDPAAGLDLGPLTLAPVATLAVGSAPAGGARVAAGLALDGGREVLGVLRFGPPAAFGIEAAGGPLAELLTDLVLPIAVDLALSTQEAQDLLQHVVLGGPKVQDLLDGVVLTGPAFDDGALDPAQLFTRLLRLAANIAGHSPALPIAPLVVRGVERNDGHGGQVYGLSVSLPPGQRFPLVPDDVTLDLEVDDSWVTGTASAAGLTLELLRVAAGQPEPFFGLVVRGIGLRVGRSSGPLLDTFLRVESVAVHTLFSATTAGGVADVGGQLELTGLAVGVGSADGGTNKVASGVLRDAASGGEPPRPAFSPALAIQRHGPGGVEVDLRAGTGSGPWWVSLQRSFGPVYIEQVGFGVTKAGQSIVAARVLVDGKVSLLGLLIAVDGLALGARWPQTPGDPPPYDPLAWEVGLDGLSVAADTGGVMISGGLRKGPGAAPDYVGMISIRFGVYALSAYGGYAVVTDAQGDFTSLFIYGAVNAPIGGVPAFFVTGLAAGVGINRLLLLPSDLGQFGTYPLLQALDRSGPMADPDNALDQLRAYFPAARGAFWFAAGLSFTSFALVEGIAVVGVAVGDGLDISGIL